MSDWNSADGVRLYRRMGETVSEGCYPSDLHANDAARQLGERHGMHVALEPKSERYKVRRWDGTWIAVRFSYTAACMAMAELCLKEEGR